MMYNATEFLQGLFVPDTRPCSVAAISPAPRVSLSMDVDDLPGDWRVWFEECAAIKEYHGHLPRELAEAQALAEAIELMRKEKVQVGVDLQ